MIGKCKHNYLPMTLKCRFGLDTMYIPIGFYCKNCANVEIPEKIEKLSELMKRIQIGENNNDEKR